MLNSRLASLAARFSGPFVLALFVTILTFAHGMPLLRHDWSFPISQSALPAAAARLFQPWFDEGIGTAQPYPTLYAIGILIYPLSVLPPAAYLFVITLCACLSVTLAADAIARVSEAPEIAQRFTCSALAALNPWTYTELVAGHIFMIWSFGLVMWLFSEMLRKVPRKTALVILCALLVSQLEFFTLCFIPMAIWTIKTRMYRPFAAMLIAAAPIGFGMVSHYSSVRSTPYIFEWQQVQSVPFLAGIVMRGYSAGYDHAFAGVTPILWGFVIAAGLALVWSMVMKQRQLLWLWSGGLIALIVAGAATSPLAPLMRFAVLNIPETGIFREGYDLIAFVAIAIVAGTAFWLQHTKRFQPLIASTALLLAIPWILSPPFSHFVPQKSVPATELPGSPTVRTLLLPEIQPLSLNGRGSGFDFDAFPQKGRSLPINTFFPSFPATTMPLGRRKFKIEAEALGVQYVISRPYLQSDARALAETFRLPRTSLAVVRRLHPYPILGLVSEAPKVVAIGKSMASFGVSFADIGMTPAFIPIQPSREFANPQRGWVDARIMFAAYPQIATRYGGTFTRSAASLALPTQGASILAWTDGEIVDKRGRRLVPRFEGLRWWPRRSAAELRCRGVCAVIAVGDPPTAENEGPVLRPVRVSFQELTPWLYRAWMPTHGACWLRFSEQYDASWHLLGAAALAHIRLDESLNAWELPGAPAGPAYILNLDALIQLSLEVFALLALVAVTLTGGRKAKLES